MQISPWESIALNAAYAVITGLTIPVVQQLGFGDHAAQIVAWAGLAAVPLNMALHALTNSSPGPLAPPDAPAVVAAQKLVDLPVNTPAPEVAVAKAEAKQAIDNH